MAEDNENPWVIENRRGTKVRAYRAASPSSSFANNNINNTNSMTMTNDDLDKIMAVSLKNSPSKTENKKIKNLINNVKERMATLETQYDDTKSVMTEMKELLLEQQKHIRMLQTKEAERQIIQSYMNGNDNNSNNSNINKKQNKSGNCNDNSTANINIQVQKKRRRQSKYN